MRDHQPILIEEFNGLWKRGDADSTPADHFSDCNNVAYIESGFRTRDGIQPFQTPRADGIRAIVRMYTFNTSLDGLITMDSSGNFYHVIPGTSITQILTVAGADDFTMAYANGRAFINPFSAAGLNDFLYIYNGDGTQARKAGGIPPVNADGALAAANSAIAGNVEAGIHIFGVVYETNSGFETQIGPDTLAKVLADDTHKVDLTNICVSPNSYVVKRHIVASKSIDPAFFTGNLKGYELFFVPGGDLNDNTSTTLTVNFYDAELLESAADNFDLLSSISNGNGGLSFYHNRLVVAGCGAINMARVSKPGEFEAFSALDGFILMQNDGLGMLNTQEYRDILYAFKINETLAFTDNGDVPTSWPSSVVDEGLGAGIHGVIYIDTRQGVNSEFLVVENYSGIFMFNGTFQRPELSYKIKDLWVGSTGGGSGFSQVEIARSTEIYNDVLNQIIYLNFPSLFLILIGDYANAMNPEKIRWSKWTFTVKPNTITLFSKTNQLLIGSTGTT